MEKEIVRDVVLGDKHNMGKSANCKAQISTMCGVNDTDLCVAICRFSQVVFVTSSNVTHNLLFYFQYFLVLIIYCNTVVGLQLQISAHKSELKNKKLLDVIEDLLFITHKCNKCKWQSKKLITYRIKVFFSTGDKHALPRRLKIYLACIDKSQEDTESSAHWGRPGVVVAHDYSRLHGQGKEHQRNKRHPAENVRSIKEQSEKKAKKFEHFFTQSDDGRDFDWLEHQLRNVIPFLNSRPRNIVGLVEDPLSLIHEAFA